MTPCTQEADETLVRTVLSGGTDRFEVLVERHVSKVYAIAHAHLGLDADIDDIAQDTFISAFRSLDKLKNPGHFGFWVAAIARNAAKRRIRGIVRARKTHDAYGEQTVDSVFEDPMETERYRIVVEAVDGLADDHREALLLFYFAGMTTADMALDLGVSQEAVKKRLQRARDALGVKLAGQAEELLQSRVPRGAQVKSIALAIAGISPAWLAAATGGGTISAATLTGGSVMIKKLIVVLGVSTVVAGAATFMVDSGGAAPPAPEPEILLAASEPPSAPEPEVPAPAVAEAPTAEPVAAEVESVEPAPEAAPARPVAPHKVPAYRARQSTMAGGNAQRTGFYNLKAPRTKPAQRWSVPLGPPGGFPGVMPVVALDGSILADYGKKGENYFGRFSASGVLLWEVERLEGSRALGTSSLLSNGTVIHAFAMTSRLMAAYDARTGESIWTLEGVHARHEAPVVDRRDNVYITANGPSGLARVDGNTGEVIWPKLDEIVETKFFAYGSPTLSLDESTLYAGVKPGASTEYLSSIDGRSKTFGRIVSVNAQDGALNWTYAPEENFGHGESSGFNTEWSSPVVGSNSTIYVQDAWTGVLIALEDRGSSAAERWVYSPKWAGDVLRFEERKDSSYTFETLYNAHDVPRMTATDGENVYMGAFGYPASIHAIKAEDGTMVWRRPLEGNSVIGSPAVTPDAVYVLAAGDDKIEGTNALYCLDRTSGEILWEYPVAGPHGDTGESIGLGADGTIYVVSSGLDGEQCVLMALR